KASWQANAAATKDIGTSAIESAAIAEMLPVSKARVLAGKPEPPWRSATLEQL
ncbi:MAG: hypothetical protein RL752_437, partial [Actinomycetota bacterium]